MNDSCATLFANSISSTIARSLTSASRAAGSNPRCATDGPKRSKTRESGNDIRRLHMRWSLVALAVVALAGYVVSRGVGAESPQVAHGKYLVLLGGCTDCHTPGHLPGKPDMSRSWQVPTWAWRFPAWACSLLRISHPTRSRDLAIGPRSRSRPPFKRESGLTAVSSRPSCHGAPMPV